MTRGQGSWFTRAFHLWNQCDAHSPQIDRTGYPYQRQFDALAAFFRTSGNPALPLIFVGDFNIGKALSRQVAMR